MTRPVRKKEEQMADTPTREEAVKAHETLMKWCRECNSCHDECPFNDICLTYEDGMVFSIRPEFWEHLPEAPDAPT